MVQRSLGAECWGLRVVRFGVQLFKVVQQPHTIVREITHEV